MGKRGPSKVPNEVKEKRGTIRPEDRDANNPQPVPGIDPPPDWMPDEARAEWFRIVPDLQDMLTVGKVDRNALVSMCLSWAEYCKYTRYVWNNGLAETTGGGKRIRSPEAIQAENAFKRWERLAKQFGCTPSARADIDLGSDDSGEGKDKYFNAG